MPSSDEYLNFIYELPYDGSKEILLVEDVDDRDFLIKLFNTM